MIFTCKDSGSTYSSNWTSKNDQIIKIPGIEAEFIVLSGINFFGGIVPRKLAMILRDLRHILKISFFVYSENRA